jgi:hypothetical protein
VISTKKAHHSVAKYLERLFRGFIHYELPFLVENPASLDLRKVLRMILTHVQSTIFIPVKVSWLAYKCSADLYR